MTWTPIDTQEDLDALERAICWEDSRVVEYHAGSFQRAYFPHDVSRTGHDHPDIHVLLETDADFPFAELVFVHCDHIGANAFRNFYVRGRVRSLKRVELSSLDGDIWFSCARMMWRKLSEVDLGRSFYVD